MICNKSASYIENNGCKHSLLTALEYITLLLKFLLLTSNVWFASPLANRPCDQLLPIANKH